MATERKEKMLRVLQVMESTDEKSPLNAEQIIEKLNNRFTLGELERRSIYSDIKMLQYCGYKISKCANPRKGWYMEKHAFEDWEIKIMMDSVEQAQCVSVSEAAAIKDKLMKLTSDRGRFRFSHMMRTNTKNVDEDKTTGKYIEMLIEAIYIHKKIEFQYTEVSNDMTRVLRREGKIYKLNLYTIYWSGNNYYLVGAHDNHDGLTHYRLDRILNLKISDEKVLDACKKVGPNPEDFIRKYIEESVNHFSGEAVRIEVEYNPDPVANAILYDFAGKDIKVRKLQDDTYMATFTKMNSVTLTAWFMQYANRFKVIKPEKLKEDVRRELTEAVNKYNE